MNTIYSKSNIRTSTVIIYSLFLFLLFGTLNASSTGLNSLGFLSLSAVLGVSNVFLWIGYFKFKRINKTHLLLFCISTIFVAISIIGSLSNFTPKALTNIGQFCLCIGMVVFLSIIKWNKIKIKIVGNLASAFICVQFLIWAISGFRSPFLSIYDNSNLIGPYMLFTIFFVLLAKQHTKKRIYLLFILLGILVMFGSDTRSTLLSGLVAASVYLSWSLISKGKIIYFMFFALVVTVLLSFIFIYPRLPEWEHFMYFENLMLQYTEKSLMSGRNTIWVAVIDAINQQPWFGYGSGASTSDVTSIQASTHNLFLQITLQNGYLGLILFLMLMATLWMSFFKQRNNQTVRLAASFFIAILIHQSFEIALTQYQLSIGLLQWFIIAIGLSYSVRPFNKQAEEEAH